MTLAWLRRASVVVALLAALGGASACSSSGSSSGSSQGGSAGASPGASTGAATAGGGLSGSITVFAASSLKEAFTTLGDQFMKAHSGTKLTFNFDASSSLAESVTEGQASDVFASASSKNMDTVVQAGDADKPIDFVKNRMEIATPPGNPAGIKTVADLAKPGVKVALCDPAVPCGSTALEVFQHAKVTVRPTASEPDVKSTLGVVETKEVDAGMVYVTDVRTAGSSVTGVPIPDNLNASTTYPIAVLKKSNNHDLAQAWVNYVLSASGQKVLIADGFLKP
jgi:molybdate transport system substrate-binding protein